MQSNEIWKGVVYNGKDFGDLYECSSMGRVRKTSSKRIISQYADKRNSMKTSLTIDGRQRTISVSVLIAETFLDRSHAKKTKHINGDCSDNRLENLEWEKTILSETGMTTKEICEKFDVSEAWVGTLFRKGTLLQCIEEEKIGNQRRKTKIKPGEVFGDLEVIERADNKRGYKMYRVRHLLSGAEAVVRGVDLINGSYIGKNLSSKFPIPANNTVSGRLYRKFFKNSPEFNSWEEFEEWALSAGYTEEYSIPRLIDKEKGYVKGNVIFTRRGILVTWRDQTKTISEWAEVLGCSRQNLSLMYKAGTLENYIGHILAGEPRITKKRKD